MADLQGEWTVTTVSDMPVPPDKTMTLAFSGDQFRIMDKGDTTVLFQFKVDATLTPMTIDLRQLDSPQAQREDIGKITLGLVEVNGSTLRIAMPVDDNAPRPTDFRVYEKSGYAVFVAVRR